MRLFALLALVVVASAHNFMMDPPQRGGASYASTTAVCGAAYAGPTQSYFEGDTFQATWSTNHADGNRMYVSIAKYTAGDTAFAGGTNAPGPILYSADYPSSAGGTSDTRTVTVPTGSLGIHTFQWTWAGWYNCIDFNIYAQPPTGATPATVNPATLEPITSDTVYLTADGYGLFDVTNGNISCNTGYTPEYDEEDVLVGCQATGSADATAIQITLYFAMSSSSLSPTFEADLKAALAAALGADESQFLIMEVVSGNTTGVTVTINIQPSEDGVAASVVYTELLEQYNTPTSALLTSPILSSLDTTIDLDAIFVAPGSGDSNLSGTSGDANTVAAAVMVPLAFAAIAVLAFLVRQPARSALQSATGSRSVTGMASCTAVFTFILFLLVLIATGAQTWSTASNDTTVGPFVTCTGSSCWNSLSVWPAASAGLLNACRTFMLFSVFASIAALISLVVVAADKAGAQMGRMMTFNYSILLFITVCNFISVCMWGAFKNDYLGSSYGYGYAFAIANINWVMGVFLTITAYATSLNGDTSTGGKSVNSPTSTPQV